MMHKDLKSILHAQVELFFTALMFFTRIPCPRGIDHSAEKLNRSSRYFPLVGWVIGGACALLYSCCRLIGFPAQIAVILSTGLGILLTGAFHEDGFADCCDGFGGGFTKEKVLTIMKDSRIGAFGAIGFMTLFLLKISCLSTVANAGNLRWMWATLLVGHALSRFASLCLMSVLDYVQDIDASKVKPMATSRPDPKSLTLAGVSACLPLILFADSRALLLLPVAAGCAWASGAYFKRRIGGYTGDCLGAAQQVTECAIYLTVILL